MKRTQKRGFTIVELVIVIAVIAILAAILIPTFSGIIEKANQSSDIQLIKNLNAALSVELQSQGNPNGRFATAYDSVVVCAKNGYLVDMIVAKSSLDIAWSRNTGTFMLINTGTGEVVYPTGDGTETLDATGDEVNYFVFRSELPSAGTKDADYSIFAGYGWNTTKVLINGVGFDAGYYTNIASIEYKNTTGEARDVLVRSNTFGTRMSVDGREDDEMTHYGFAGLVDIKKIANASYYENGIVGRLSITAQGAKGHVVIREGATVFQIEQLGGDATSVSVDAKASVYDINHELVAGAIERTSERFTTESTASFTVTETHSTKSGEGENAKNGERITAQECVHDYTVDILDSKHVYEVCKTCGYTLIKVGDEKQTVSKDAKDENEETVSENVIIPKATYGVDQVTANNNDKGDVKINIDSQTGEYVEPSVVSTPVVDDETAIDMTCKHDWKYTSNDDETHKVTCSLCGASFTESCHMTSDVCDECGYTHVCRHVQYNAETERLYYNCPYCDVEFGTEEIPYYLSEADHFEALLKLYDWNGDPGYYQVYRVDEQGENAYLYVELTDDIDCSTVDFPTGYSQVYALSFDGKGHTISNINTNGYLFQYAKDYTCFNNIKFDNCSMKGFWYSNNTGVEARNVSFNKCNFSESIFGYYLYYYADFDNIEVANSTFKNFVKYPFYQLDKASYTNMKFKNCTITDTCFGYVYDSFLTMKNCEYDSCKTTGCALVTYGGYSSYSKKTGIDFDNVDIRNCKCGGGSYVYYGGSRNYPFSFKNCDVINTEVYGGNGMALGGFVGNASTSTVTVEDCSFAGYIESSREIAAGIIGQPAISLLTIKNTSISADTVIVNKDSGGVAPFSGNNENWNKDNNKFLGTLSAGSIEKVSYNGFSSDQVTFAKYSNQIAASDFTIDSKTGLLKYVGNKTFDKLVVSNIICAFDNIKAQVGGYSWSIQDIVYNNTVENGTEIGYLLFVDKYIQIVDEEHKNTIGASTTDDSIIEGLTALDGKYLFYYDAGTLIYDTRLPSSGETRYVYSGTQNVGSLPKVGSGTVLVQVYNDGELVGSVNVMYFNFDLINE